MLFSQQGGRREDCHLLAIHDGQKRGPQCHFGFSESDIAADQPIHRLARDHILGDGMDCGKLIGSLLESESICEALVFLGIKAKGVALTGSATGVDIE